MATNILKGARVYLSGPMDFVGSRVIEKYLGWRALLTPILKALGVTILDPWNKPTIRGHHFYGEEGATYSKEVYESDFWTHPGTRARFEQEFWETVHLDLRMVDMADFLIAFIPTNIYSVGTVHEIVLARTQHKPVLCVSPPIEYDFFPELNSLSDKAKAALKHYGLKENSSGIPSQWYGNIVGGQNFFNGFGWENLPFKSDDFYPSLIENVLNLTKPTEHRQDIVQLWEEVTQWIQEFEPLKQLNGGILHHISFRIAAEKALLQTEMERMPERDRNYFWYNHQYMPVRPLLFQLFSIAAGHVPPRLNIVSEVDEQGEVHYRSFESIDDNWMLLSPPDES
jgi:hypothetical protein